MIEKSHLLKTFNRYVTPMYYICTASTPQYMVADCGGTFKLPAMNHKTKKLILCLLLDAVGYVSFAIPFVGEFSDIVWAPIAAMISYKMFGEKRGKYTAFTTFAEEILPFTDIIPSFTIFCIVFDWVGVGKEKKTPILQTK